MENKTIRIVAIIAIALILSIAIGLLCWDAYLESKLDKINQVSSSEGLTFVTQTLVDTGEAPTYQPTLTDPYTNPATNPSTTPATTPVENPPPSMENVPRISDTEDVKNILLLATDARTATEAGRSDTMILLSINEQTKKITLCSFARDTLVYIPGRGWDKLNHSHAYGGANLVMQTFEANFNIHVDHFFRITFYSFIEAVDAIGGLDIKLSVDEIKTLNWYLLEINELLGRPEGTDNLPEVAGTYHLNGKQALGYARNRYDKMESTGGVDDFARTDRQRHIIELMIEKAKTLSVLELNSLIDQCLPLITTNMNTDQMKDLVNSVPFYLFYDRNSIRYPATAWKYDYHNSMSIIRVDFEKNTKRLYEAVYGVPPAAGN